MYLEASTLGQGDGTLAPTPSSTAEFVDPLEASLVAQFAALRSYSELARNRQRFVNDAHGFLVGLVAGAAAGYFTSDENKLRNAAVGGVVGAVADLAVLVAINVITNATPQGA